MHISEETIKQILNSPSISFWLKDAIRSLDKRDVLDMNSDIKLLLKISNYKLNKSI